MEKIDVILVVMNHDALEATVKNLNHDRANLVAIVADGYAQKSFTVGKNKIPVTTFATIHLYFTNKFFRLLWLICGGTDNELRKMKKFLTASGVPENQILHFEVPAQISATWSANLRHIDEHGADFFVTGNEYVQLGVNLNLIPYVQADISTRRGGIVLADTNQTLRQSYLIAKHVFAHVAPGTIKFVLIGLMPHAIRYDNATNFLYALQNLQYGVLNEPTACDERIINLVSDDFKKNFATVTTEQADLNFDSVKATYNGELSAKAIADWESAANFFMPDADENNNQIVKDYVVLKDYIELCLANGAQPVGVMLPFAPAVRKNFDQKLLSAFRKMIRQLEKSHDFTCVDMFELTINYGCFFDMTHINEAGQSFVNSMISFELWRKKLLPADGFCDMCYEYFGRLGRRAPKDDYNELMNQVFDITAKRISRKKKIKIGFVMYDASMWSGDDLYNFFARDERFEPTIFLCLRPEYLQNDVILNDFLNGVEQFKSHGLNIFPAEPQTPIPHQDLVLFLTPYLWRIAEDFQPKNLTANTLMMHIPYSLDISLREKKYYNLRIFCTAWKIFFSSVIAVKVYAKYNSVGMPRGFFSGYPRMDIFFEPDVQFHFDWKMVRPDAKKIIYAPHHSVTEDSVRYSTFQWNYKFMYEFAKAHPEISWVVKPHPNLSYRAINAGIFPDFAAYEEYLKAWDDLPNAQVYTGAYYQDIFATSDGMIHDSGSFIAEYQYVDKPMIYLTRDTQRYNELGDAILNVSYCVDGQDLDAIAATLKRVIIDGDDYRAEERRELFNRYLNYPQYNGMLAGEFIYRSIADELKDGSK